MIRAEGFDVKLFHHAQRHQRSDALPVRRNFGDFIAAITNADRVHPVRDVRREIDARHQAAVRLCMRHDTRRKRATIERFALTLRDQAQSLSLRRIAEQLARQRRATTRHEMLGIARLLFQNRHGARPLPRDDRRDHKAALCDVNRWCEQISERQLAVALRQRHPARHRARH